MRELLGSERYGLAPETRQSLLALRVFQQMDGAILCLLQQPGGAAGAAPRPWNSLRRCCESQRDGMGWEGTGVTTSCTGVGAAPGVSPGWGWRDSEQP